jgi:transitional endoplasmic reticulum ATPase
LCIAPRASRTVAGPWLSVGVPEAPGVGTLKSRGLQGRDMTDQGIQLTVQGAEKEDAGRGVARLPEPARSELGVLSGDTVVVQGERATVAKVWPGGAETDEETIRIDADSRTNAGVSIGDTVQVHPVDVEEATAVSLTPPRSLSEEESAAVERVVKRDLRDRPVSEGEQVHIERLSDAAFVISDTRPGGTVSITEETTVSVVDAGSVGGAAGEATEDPRAGVTYEDIGGLDEELDQVREMVELPLSEPELFRRAGIDPPKGVLLHGPPGTGKTLIAKAVANEVDATFHHISGPEIMKPHKGDSEKRIREVFEEAGEDAPSIVFFDEIDAIAEKREETGGMESRVVGQLLSEMDGLDARGDVIVIAATNRADSLDPALRRGGRFDREILIGVPDAEGRQEILEVHTRRMPLSEAVSLDRLADRTHGFVGADLDAFATEAGMAALRRYRDAGREGDMAIEREDFEAALASVEPSAMREYVAETPEVSFDDVGGLEDAKRTLREAVEWPLSYGPLFDAASTDPPTGVLLHGPPGTGKTMLARAIANESDVNFIHVTADELVETKMGESEKAVRELFSRARQAAPSIIFLDELDAIAGARGGETHDLMERIVSQLLTELDGMADNPNLMLLAATNRREDIDEALLRPGRIEEHVLVPEPDEEARREILAVHAAGKPLSEDVDLDALAAELEGYTGADLEAIVRTGAMQAIRDVAEDVDPEEAAGHAGEVVIGREELDDAIEHVEPSGR